MLIIHGLENVVIVDVRTQKCGKTVLMGANNEGMHIYRRSSRNAMASHGPLAT
jgi:hypothetical protein